MQPSHLQPVPALEWALPFLGLLISIALFPAVAPRFWHRRVGAVAFAWSLILLAQQAVLSGFSIAMAAVLHAMLVEYLPFITLLLALYTAGGGVLLRGGPAGTPAANVAMLIIGMLLGVVMGTTAASMVLVRPLLQANAHRRRRFHLVLFLILLVANASGGLTPLGNPPLYIGLLHGVPFFWPARHLFLPLFVLSGLLLSVFYLVDRRLAHGEPPPAQARRLAIRGWPNLALILVVIAAVLLQGLAPATTIWLLGQPIRLGQLAAVGVFLLVTLLSIWWTPRAVRQANDFAWHPIMEVVQLFAAIFITIAPVIEMLRAGLDGPLAPLLRLTQDAQGQPMPLAYFWMTGVLSAFLDNAPSYLVLFGSAGINPPDLAPGQTTILAAISAGAVFFGGLTYIGNAPNMMIRAIASHQGVRMPGFVTYLLYAALVLLPALTLVSLLFFR